MDKFVYHKKQKLLENIYKSVKNPSYSGNKGFPVGTVREWNGVKYKKRINKEWHPISDSDNSKEDKGSEENTSNLTRPEEISINNYTQSKYKQINQYLRGKISGDKGIKEDVENIRSALKKLDSYNNDFGTLFRGIVEEKEMQEIKKEYENLMEEGSILEYDSFLSTTGDLDRVFDFLSDEKEGKTPVIFKINSKDNNSKGKEIQEYSAYPTEDEILFEERTEFEVTGVENEQDIEENNYLIVKLKEI